MMFCLHPWVPFVADARRARDHDGNHDDITIKKHEHDNRSNYDIITDAAMDNCRHLAVQQQAAWLIKQLRSVKTTNCLFSDVNIVLSAGVKRVDIYDGGCLIRLFNISCTYSYNVRSTDYMKHMIDCLCK